MSVFLLNNDSHFHKGTFLMCLGIILMVFMIFLFSLIKHRYATQSHEPHFHSCVFAEIFWACLPLLISFILLLPTLRLLKAF